MQYEEDESSPSNPQPLYITENCITLIRDDALHSISLSANPTTGYRRTIQSYDPRLLQVSLKFKGRDTHGEIVAGAGGTDTITIERVAGELKSPVLTFVVVSYAQAWMMSADDPSTMGLSVYPVLLC